MTQDRVYTAHALTRMAQRGICLADIEYVLAYGLPIHSGGAQHVHLREKDMPEVDRHNCEHRLGIQVLLDPEGTTIVTVYKNRRKDVLKKVRRKAKYDRRPFDGARWQSPDVAAHARHIHGVLPFLDLQLRHDLEHVVLDGLRRKREAFGDLCVG